MSENQYRYCLELIDKLGLGNQVTVILGDYRNLEGNFDHIFSVEMIEAVGHKGLDFFRVVCPIAKRQWIDSTSGDQYTSSTI
ncbi:MAG: hypothetical protein CM1200mP3_09780 [Chloroflexota bacterium]|nr:MAG: hypothetical protein CM1200mP3_09780 [Chloroflexota bacterium]